MNKLSIPEELKDLSGAKLKEAMIKYRKKKIVKLVCGQTNYDEEYAQKLLEENNYNYLTIVKEYLNPKAESQKKDIVEKSLNQQIFGQIRNFLDEGYKEVERRKRIMAKTKKIQQMRKAHEDKQKALAEGNKKII